MVQILQKTIKELNDEEESFRKANKNEQADNVAKQKEVISMYLPKLLSEDEIYDIISKLDDKTIPNVMKHFKTNYSGKVEMAKVSVVLKKFN